jgi:hypothetical protein
MSDGGLVRTASVLEVEDIEDDIVSFSNESRSAFASHRGVGLAMSGDTWLDFGTPDEITVTVEPGNTLE